MNLKQLLSLIFFLPFSLNVTAQLVSDNQILKLATHPTDSAKFVAKMYNSRTGVMEEYWEMITFVPDICVADFNKQVQAREIVADGKCIFLYENRVKKMELYYENGCKKGEFKGYYNTGELRFQGTNNCGLEGKLTHYNTDGSIKKEENFRNGILNGKSVCYDSFGEIQRKTDYSDGVRNGKQIIYYPGGNQKRVLKFKQDEVVSDKCYDENGEKMECSPLVINPTYVKGDDLLFKDLSNHAISINQPENDTVNCRIMLSLDENGIAEIQEFHCKTLDSIPPDLQNWLEEPDTFAPLLYDHKPLKCIIQLKFSLCGNQIVMDGELKKHHFISRDKFTQELTEVFFWQFPSSTNQELYFIANKMPEYPGGEIALKKFLAQNIRYPVEAQKNNIHGKVYVSFVIDVFGRPVNFSVAKGVHPLLDREALRVVKLMPDWTPGENIDGPVAVSYTVPINFVKPAVGHHSIQMVNIEL